uniref:DNA repair protein SWI5 homolog n=1 Tax=Trichuris muris TaxID=70415 RepID=A0A5S6R5C2_TRIMR
MKRRSSCDQPFKLPLKRTTSAQGLTTSQVPLSDPTEEEKQLDAAIEELQQKGCSIDYLNDYMNKLHYYNDLKDLAQSLIGLLAGHLGVTTQAIYAEYDLNLDD